MQKSFLDISSLSAMVMEHFNPFEPHPEMVMEALDGNDGDDEEEAEGKAIEEEEDEEYDEKNGD